MRYAFFDIPARGAGSGTEALNRFLAEHQVLSVDRQLVIDGQASYWAVSVTWLDGEPAPAGVGADSKGRKPKIDYKEVLSPRDFGVFAAMRDLRKQLAEAEGVPAYALFNNEQLAEMAQTRVQSADALARINGVGKARVDKYGAAFLEILRAHPPTDAAKPAPRQPPNTDAPHPH